MLLLQQACCHMLQLSVHAEILQGCHRVYGYHSPRCSVSSDSRSAQSLHVYACRCMSGTATARLQPARQPANATVFTDIDGTLVHSPDVQDKLGEFSQPSVVPGCFPWVDKASIKHLAPGILYYNTNTWNALLHCCSEQAVVLARDHSPACSS